MYALPHSGSDILPRSSPRLRMRKNRKTDVMYKMAKTNHKLAKTVKATARASMVLADISENVPELMGNL